MRLFQKRYADDDWEAGVPESFKAWFWIRLAVSLYVGYIGVDLIIRFVRDGLAWWYLLLAGVFLLVAITFLVMDVVHYVRLKKHLKEKALAEAEAAANEDPEGGQTTEHQPEKVRPVPTEKNDRSPDDDRELTGIRDFAKYVAKEGDADDEV